MPVNKHGCTISARSMPCLRKRFAVKRHIATGTHIVTHTASKLRISKRFASRESVTRLSTRNQRVSMSRRKDNPMFGKEAESAEQENIAKTTAKKKHKVHGKGKGKKKAKKVHNKKHASKKHATVKK